MFPLALRKLSAANSGRGRGIECFHFLAQILIGFAQIEYAKVLSKGKGFTLPRTSASQTTKKT